MGLEYWPVKTRPGTYSKANCHFTCATRDVLHHYQPPYKVTVQNNAGFYCRVWYSNNFVSPTLLALLERIPGAIAHSWLPANPSDQFYDFDTRIHTYNPFFFVQRVCQFIFHLLPFLPHSLWPQINFLSVCQILLRRRVAIHFPRKLLPFDSL